MICAAGNHIAVDEYGYCHNCHRQITRRTCIQCNTTMPCRCGANASLRDNRSPALTTLANRIKREGDR